MGRLGPPQDRPRAHPERVRGGPGARRRPRRTRSHRQTPRKVPSHRFGLVFSMIFRVFSFVSRVVFRSLFVRFLDGFSIGFRSFFRSKASSHLERPIIAEHRFLCAWPVFRSVFSKSCIFERTTKRWTKRSKVDREFDGKNIEKSMEDRSKNRSTTRSNRRSKKGSKKGSVSLENRGPAPPGRARTSRFERQNGQVERKSAFEAPPGPPKIF